MRARAVRYIYFPCRASSFYRSVRRPERVIVIYIWKKKIAKAFRRSDVITKAVPGDVRLQPDAGSCLVKGPRGIHKKKKTRLFVRCFTDLSADRDDNSPQVEWRR